MNKASTPPPTHDYPIKDIHQLIKEWEYGHAERQAKLERDWIKDRLSRGLKWWMKDPKKNSKNT